MEANGAFFAEYDPAGRPYLGFAWEGPGCSLSVVLAYAQGAGSVRDSLIDVVNQLLVMKPKLMVVQEVPHGIHP